MLDMGTGGGEVLSGLPERSTFTVATEAWPSNVHVAATRLRPLSIPVVQVEGARDNVEQSDDRGSLPFRDSAFSLVTNRHEAFVASEVARVLTSGGSFVTQQVDFHSYDDLYRALGREVPAAPASWLRVARDQLERAGFRVKKCLAGQERQTFDDIGAVVYYLRMVPWAVEGFDAVASMASLRRLHERIVEKPLRLRQRRFLLVAEKGG
jgi:SAM-dependent methyltransferase